MANLSPKSKFGQKTPIIRMRRRSDVIASYSRSNSADNSDYSDFEDTKSVKSQASKFKSP